MKIILAVIGVWTLLFLAFAFAHMSLDPHGWSEDSRVGFSFVALLSSAVMIVPYFIEKGIK